MSYNGSGTFVINSAGQPVVTGTVISSTAFNALTADLATGLSTALTKDGQTTPTANLPMGTFKFTGLSAGSAATDSANIAQVQNSFGSFLTVSGTDTITATVSPSLTAYASGQMFAFVAANTNTGAVTINISSLGAKAITKNGNTALSAGDLTANYLFVVVYDGTQFQVVGVSATTFTNLTISGVLTLSGAGTQLLSTGTGAWQFPNGTTGQRPGTPAVGMTRYNSSLDQLETYVTAGWQAVTSLLYNVSYLAVAGGAGGGLGSGGGGGAGGLLTGTVGVSSGASYSIVIGAGGSGATSSAVAGGAGGNTTGLTVSATGGGGGGSYTGSSSSTTVGQAGGSGGGGSGRNGTTQAGGAGTSGQGFAGGASQSAANYGSGGGGGASAAGSVGGTTAGGAGGAGSSSSISGSAVTYGGGGGGGATDSTTAGAGGSGGGGAGSANPGTGTAGTANLGGGGGGGGGTAGNGGAGGSGVFVISYAGAQRGTGGTVTSSGGNTIHTFTSSGTYTA